MSGASAIGRRFLVVAPAVPVEVSGTNIVVRRLLENFDGSEVVLLGRPPNRRARLDAQRLHYPVVRLHAPARGVRGERFLRIAAAVPGVMQGWSAVRRHRPTCILAMFPDECSLLTGYLLHRVSAVPLFAYFCDLYSEDRRPGTWEGWMARQIQDRVFKAARRVLAINEGMVDFYLARYGLQAACLPTCINQPIPPYAPPPDPGRPFRIGYSGNVNEARIDSLRALVEAFGGDPNFSLRYFTPQTPAFLERLGVWAPNASAQFVDDEAALVPLLAECDAFFLPLTFRAVIPSRDQLATCFGIKSYEYFLAQRPVIVHTPGDYFLARFYRQWECGLVVDDPSPAALRAGFARIREDRSLRERVVRQGLSAARTFAGPRIADLLRRELRHLGARAGEEGAPPGSRF